MVKVKMIKTTVQAGGPVRGKGQVYEVDEATAERLVMHGQAEYQTGESREENLDPPAPRVPEQGNRGAGEADAVEVVGDDDALPTAGKVLETVEPASESVRPAGEVIE